MHMEPIYIGSQHWVIKDAHHKDKGRSNGKDVTTQHVNSE